jgi:hypothetical protein
MESLPIDVDMRKLSFAGGLLEAQKRRPQLFAIQRAPGETATPSEQLKKKLDTVNTAVLTRAVKSPKPTIS